MIELSSSGVPLSVRLNPVHSRTTGRGVNPSGDYLLELLDSSDGVLRSISFEAGEVEVECFDGPCPSGSEPQTALFGFVINEPPDYLKLRFSKSGETFATISRSASAPVLSGPAMSSSASEPFEASDTIELSWAATDNDSDDLRYTLFYSTDSGRTYWVWQMNTNATSVTIRADELEGSDTARFAVSVSDGLRTVFSAGEIFSIVGKPPTASIGSSGASISGRQSLVLTASGYDGGGGNLPSSAFSWHSSIDGDLGTGRYIVISGADLSPGEHEITMTATDRAGLQATDRINIVVNP